MKDNYLEDRIRRERHWLVDEKVAHEITEINNAWWEVCFYNIHAARKLQNLVLCSYCLSA